jgi:hypothetical protein
VPIGLSKFIWAMGGASSVFSYHGPKRGVDAATFRTAPSSSPTNITPTMFSVDYLFNAEVPAAHTTYSCKTFSFNRTSLLSGMDSGQTYYVVGVEPIVQNTTKDMVHHLLAMGCNSDAPYPPSKFRQEGECFSGNMPQNCNSVMYVWVSLRLFNELHSRQRF